MVPVKTKSFTASTRRAFGVGLLGAALALGAGFTPAHSKSNGPVTLVVPFGPGGGVDTVVRAIAERLSPVLGRTVLVENRPGASTLTAYDYVTRGPADGTVFLVGTPALSTNQALQPKMGPGDPRKLLKPVLPIAEQPYMLVAGPALPKEVVDVKSLLAWAKANPGALDMVNSGALTAPRLAAELLAFKTKTPIVTIPYQSGTAGALDVVGGRVSAGINQIIEVLPQINAGKLRPLAVTSLQRSPVFPNIPAISETVEGFDTTSWNGLFAPAQTPDEAIVAMNTAMNTVLKDKSLHDLFRAQGTEFKGGTPDDLSKKLDSEIRRWEDLDAQIHIKLD